MTAGLARLARWQISRTAEHSPWGPTREEVIVTDRDTEHTLDGIRIKLVRELVTVDGDPWEHDTHDICGWDPDPFTMVVSGINRPMTRYRWVATCRKCYGFQLDIGTTMIWRTGIPPMVSTALIEHLGSYGHSHIDAVERVNDFHRALGVPLPDTTPDVVVDTCPVCGSLIDLSAISVAEHIDRFHP